MKLNLTYDLYAITDAPEQTTSAGGIALIKSDENTQQGIVRYAGPGLISDLHGGRVTPQFAVGDKVFFMKHVGERIKFEGEDLRVLREKDLIGSVTE